MQRVLQCVPWLSEKAKMLFLCGFASVKCIEYRSGCNAGREKGGRIEAEAMQKCQWYLLENLIMSAAANAVKTVKTRYSASRVEGRCVRR